MTPSQIIQHFDALSRAFPPQKNASILLDDAEKALLDFFSYDIIKRDEEELRVAAPSMSEYELEAEFERRISSDEYLDICNKGLSYNLIPEDYIEWKYGVNTTRLEQRIEELEEIQAQALFEEQEYERQARFEFNSSRGV